MEIACPKCSSKAYKKNGFTRHGKQNHRCLDCGRQFSLEPENDIVFEVKGQGQEPMVVENSAQNFSTENVNNDYSRWLSK